MSDAADLLNVDCAERNARVLSRPSRAEPGGSASPTIKRRRSCVFSPLLGKDSLMSRFLNSTAGTATFHCTVAPADSFNCRLRKDTAAYLHYAKDNLGTFTISLDREIRSSRSPIILIVAAAPR